MKIAFNGRVLTQKDITGVQRYAWAISKEFQKLLDPKDLKIFLPEKDSSKIAKHFWEHFTFPRLAKNWGADFLFCPGNLSPIGEEFSGKIITVIHDLSYLYYPEAYSNLFKLYYRYLIPRVMKNSYAIITVSNSEKSAIVSRYPTVNKKIFAIQNGVDEDFYPDPSEDNSGLYLLYVGSLSPRKNFQGIIEAFQNLLNLIPHNLVLIGGLGDIFRNNNFSGLLKKIPKNRLILLGHINDKNELRKWYSNAECLVFPSYYEASPLPPLEAMACGCPTIVSNIPSLQERCGNASFYCRPESITDIAEKILLLVKNPEFKKQKIELGKRWIKAFNWKETANKTLELIR